MAQIFNKHCLEMLSCMTFVPNQRAACKIVLEKKCWSAVNIGTDLPYHKRSVGLGNDSVRKSWFSGCLELFWSWKLIYVTRWVKTWRISHIMKIVIRTEISIWMCNCATIKYWNQLIGWFQVMKQVHHRCGSEENVVFLRWYGKF